ncbi:D-alanyl-D-alanine carboxypeptidase/D-alanyl-D-alanine-endopeptidase [Fibrobacter sp. UWR2]|uniref:D-alanyl-D-alanine carboxypeptidase/D-alanyl-D-alanine endopeptidase n=1 Tax=Fibrobacter sp. UWR2 TaxID=1964352 RepID=UPI001E3B061A|nr:D-alanyl-D-alanine carboxypeptidase/D-alanyl-D-alanine-endopeptidase [Fibrobacter sp. UWR2]
MRRFVVVLLFAIAPLLAGFDFAPYQAYIDSVIPEVKFGLSVRSVSTGAELLNVNANDYFTPASTMKTLSTATALHFLPLDYAPQTKVSLLGTQKRNVFTGEVNVRGEGDPNISARYYTDPMLVLYAMADSIKSLGIDTVRGRIVLDTNFFTPPWKPEHWRSDFFDYYYGAEVTPLQFNDNCTVIRIKPGAEDDTVRVSVVPDVGYVKVVNKLITKTAPRNKRGRKQKLKWNRALDPVAPVVTIEGEFDIETDSTQFVIPVRGALGYFRAALLKAFRDRGLILNEVAVASSGEKMRQFSFSSAPLLSVMDEINQRSQNLHAETLFRNAAAYMYGVGSVENGKKLERRFLAEMGLDSSGFEVYDGCGLAAKNKLKPSVETQMLAKMARHPKGEYYINSFASPRIGSGSKRMQTLLYPWFTRFKTGYIAEVHGLAGYIFTMAGDTLSVAMYLNQTGKNKDADCKNTMDSVWIALVEWANNGYPSLLRMKDMWREGIEVKGLDARLEYFSRRLMKTPYGLGKMGEGHIDTVEQKPMVYLDSVDCVTYVEHVLAMANAVNEDSLFNMLQRIRYIDGKINYRTRKHYMIVDWLGEGKFARIKPVEGDTLMERTIAKKEFFKSKKMKYLVDGKPADDPKVQIRYLPCEKARKWAKETRSDTLKVMGVAFISKAEKYDASHTGFVVFKPGEAPRLRHASSQRKQVVDMSLADYLDSRKGKLPGITLFEFIPQ